MINTPGTYVFGNNIRWNPIGPGSAISIVSSNVTIDMKNFTLQSSVTGFNTTGISATGIVNLLIKNGTFANMGCIKLD